MADKNIKKSVIKNKDLPPFSGKTGKIRLRYRIISEDRNRLSHWSKIHEVALPIIPSPEPYTMIVQETDNPNFYEVTIRWNLISFIELAVIVDYDIFIKTNTAVGEPTVSEYSFFESVAGGPRSVRFLLDAEEIDNFNVIIQKLTFDKIINVDQIKVKTTKYTFGTS